MGVDEPGAGDLWGEDAAVSGERGAAGFERLGQLAAYAERFLEQRHQRAIARHDAGDEIGGFAMTPHRFVERRRSSARASGARTISARTGCRLCSRLGERGHHPAAAFGEPGQRRSNHRSWGRVRCAADERFDVAEQSDLGVEAGDVGGEGVGDLGARHVNQSSHVPDLRRRPRRACPP